MPQQSETLASTFTVNCFVNESFLRVYLSVKLPKSSLVNAMKQHMDLKNAFCMLQENCSSEAIF